MSSDGFKIDLVGNPITGSAAYCFVITLIFIFNTILEIKISEKILGTKIHWCTWIRPRLFLKLVCTAIRPSLLKVWFSVFEIMSSLKISYFDLHHIKAKLGRLSLALLTCTSEVSFSTADFRYSTYIYSYPIFDKKNFSLMEIIPWL